MEKTNGYYVGKYLKNNAIVLVCELVVVLLLSLICTIIMAAEPVWLTPVIAVVTYLIAEVRFMMAYVATNARHEHEMDLMKSETDLDEAEDASEENAVCQAEEAAVAVTATAAVADDQPDEDEPTEQADEEPVACDEPYIEPTETVAEDEEQTDEDGDMQESAPDALFEEPCDTAEPVPDDVFDEPVSITLDEQDEQDEQETPVEPEMDVQEQEEQDTDEPEEPELVLESIEIDEDDLDDMTMDDGDFAHDVLEIGEIKNAELDSDEEDTLF